MHSLAEPRLRVSLVLWQQSVQLFLGTNLSLPADWYQKSKTGLGGLSEFSRATYIPVQPICVHTPPGRKCDHAAAQAAPTAHCARVTQRLAFEIRWERHQVIITYQVYIIRTGIIYIRSHGDGSGCTRRTDRSRSRSSTVDTIYNCSARMRGRGESAPSGPTQKPCARSCRL